MVTLMVLNRRPEFVEAIFFKHFDSFNLKNLRNNIPLCLFSLSRLTQLSRAALNKYPCQSVRTLAYCITKAEISSFCPFIVTLKKIKHFSGDERMD